MRIRDPERRSPDWYPTAYVLPTRESDIDHQGIVNNVALLGIYAEARSAWRRGWLGPDASTQIYDATLTLNIRESETLYLHRAVHGAPIVVGIRLLQASTRQCLLAAAAFQDNHCLSVQSCTLAYQRDGEWTDIPAALLERCAVPATFQATATDDVDDSAQYLDLTRHTLRYEFRTRYGDLDWRLQTHEVAIGRLMEATRYYPLREVLESDARDAYESVLGRVRIRYLRPGAFEGIIVGAASIIEIGTRSFTWCTGLFHEGRCFALAEATQIAIDDEGRSRALSHASREHLARWLHPAASAPRSERR